MPRQGAITELVTSIVSGHGLSYRWRVRHGLWSSDLTCHSPLLLRRDALRQGPTFSALSRRSRRRGRQRDPARAAVTTDTDTETDTEADTDTDTDTDTDDLRRDATSVCAPAARDMRRETNSLDAHSPLSSSWLLSVANSLQMFRLLISWMAIKGNVMLHLWW